MPGKLRLNLQERKEEPPGCGRFKVVERAVEWEAVETAVIVCDMWDDHYCKRAAQRVKLMVPRDLTDALYDPRQPPYVSHTRGTEMVIEHIEKYWCPSILGKDLTSVVPGSDDPPAAVVYVSVIGKKVIAVYRMNPTDGLLAHTSDVNTGGEAGALTTDPKRRFLFAAIRSEGKLSSFRIGPVGKLTPINTVLAGADPAHIAIDPAGRFLLTAYYVASKVTVHDIGKDGSLSDKPVQTVKTADKAHAVVFDPTGRFVYVPHTGPNAIYVFKFTADSGKLTPASPPKLMTPPNTGPRHMVFHPKAPVAYVVNEQGSSVTAYRVRMGEGSLAPLQTVSTLPADFKGTNACAEIKLHPSGKFLYASNRGHDSIARFSVDEKGKLTANGQTPTEKTPRSLDLSPNGTFLFAAGESSGKIAAYRIDAKTGELKLLKTYDAGKTPWWVMVVRSSPE